MSTSEMSSLLNKTSLTLDFLGQPTYYQCEQICSIGSGAVESGIKQISRRIKISGAQWREDNVPQVLAHRCAYLNGMIGLQR
jgi:hypothetical protein